MIQKIVVRASLPVLTWILQARFHCFFASNLFFGGPVFLATVTVAPFRLW